MKKIVSLILTCVLLASLFSTFVSAAEVEPDVPPIETEEYAYLSNSWAGLNHVGGGKYNITGGAGSVLANVTISVTVILQKSNPKSVSGWDDLATWTDANHYSASAGGSRYIYTSGTYRTHVIVNVYSENGTLLETDTTNSDHLVIS